MRQRLSPPVSVRRGKAEHGDNGAAARQNQTHSNERIVAIHPPADRDLAARCRGDVGRLSRLLVAAGLGAAAGRLPDYPGDDTQLPGANPDTIASLVTAPLERQFGQIPALQTKTSSSSFGISQVTLQFDLNRDIDGAAQDVQSALMQPPRRCLATCPIRRSTRR